MKLKKKIIALLALELIIINSIYAYADEVTKVDALTYQSNVYVHRVYIGPEVTEIADNSFVNLHDLWLISVDENNPNYSTYANCLYNKDKTRLICFPFALSWTKIPSSVVEIAPYALRGQCDHVRRRVENAVKRNRERLGIQ